MDFKSIENCNSISEILEFRAISNPNEIVYTFLDDGLGAEINLTYGELYESVLSISQLLLSKFDHQDRIVLFFPPGLDFIKAFYGCLYAGMIAVPSYPPKMNRSGERMKGILKDSTPKAILTLSNLGYEKVLSKIDTSGYTIISLNDLKEEPVSTNKIHSCINGNVAFLQYTSGSTGKPKGVIVSHENIIDNQQLIKNTFELDETSILVGWLPSYHDMGLVGNIIQAVYSGFRAILFPPVQFLKKPELWLKAISKYEATVSGAPNFAYALCVKAIGDSSIGNVDLTSWKVAFNGAEPISISTLNSFKNRFKEYGFNDNAFLPCYGMAETTLIVSGINASESVVTNFFSEKQLQYDLDVNVNKEKNIELVSCGEVTNSYQIKIVGRKGIEVQEGNVGEIWLKGKSVSLGYWNNEIKTTESFRNKAKNNEDLFFSTGDLGILKDKQLYITGRLKDLLIINGKNYYPQDLESFVCRANDNIIQDATAAFSILNDTKEQVVIIAECRLSNDINKSEIITNLQSSILETFNLSIYDILLIRRGTILKTSSGKIQRNACKLSYLNNEFRTIGSLKTIINKPKSVLEIKNKGTNETEQKLVAFISRELDTSTLVDKNKNLFEYGIDSISLTRLVFFIEDEFDVEIPVDSIFETSTILSLADLIRESKKRNLVVDEDKFIENKQLRASFLQQSIWINQQKSPHNSGYNIPIEIEFKGKVDINRIDKSLNLLLDRYEVLKTVFQLKNESIEQIIKPGIRINVSSKEIKTQEEKIKYIKSFSRKPFSLQEGPLLRASCIFNRVSPDTTLIITIHHILLDASSVGVVVRELKEIYKQSLDDNLLEGIYKEKNYFHQFCKDELIIDNLLVEKQRSFWSEKLSKLASNFSLPKSSNYSNDISGSSISFYINGDENLAIFNYIKNEQINLFSLLISAYFILLNRLSSSNDIVIGVPISLRDKKRYQNALGLFINTAMLRVTIERNEKLSDFVKKVYLETRESLQYANYPFSKIIEDLNLRVEDNRLALSSVFFNFLNNQENISESPIEEIYKSNPGVDLNFDLNLYVLPNDKQIEFRLDYKTMEFSKNSIDEMVKNYKYILSEIVDSGNNKVNQNSFKTIFKNPSLPDINEKIFPVLDKQLSVWERFYKIANLNSEKIAVRGIQKDYSYRNVLDISNNITKQISQVNSERRFNNIGLCFGHHENMIFGMLAVLKSNNAYVPIDLSLPQERKEYLIRDAETQIILTDVKNYNEVLDLIKSFDFSIEVIVIDRVDDWEINQKNGNDISESSALAYILYTSGSTGNPKGVMQTQEYIMHIAYSFINSLSITPNDTISLIPSFNFSASMMDTFGALLSGASLKIIDVKSQGIDGLINSLITSGVTIYHSVPTIYRSLLTEMAKHKNRSLDAVRVIYLAGEPLLKEDVISYKNVFNEKCVLVNALGCTEFNICSQYFIDKSTAIKSPHVPLGYNGIGVEVELLDSNNEKVNGLVEGQIALKSNYLAKGYWKLPKLTKKQFIIKNNEKYYLTGDLGRRLPDGVLVHLGRKDFQVKIRGQRIELGEIESQLLKIKQIEKVAVVLKEIGGEKVLCAYYVSRNELDISFIKQELKIFLPNYMLPQYYECLDKFPLTTTGKVDRRNLPLPVVNFNSETSIENITFSEDGYKLSVIWAEILNCKVNQITNNSDFFDFGGDSLKAIQILSRIKNIYSSKVGLQFVFDNSRFGEMLSSLNKLQVKPATIIPKSKLSVDHPLTPGQYSVWLFSQFAEASVAYNLSGVYKINGDLDKGILKSAITNLFNKYEILNASFYEKAGVPVIRIKEESYFDIDSIFEYEKSVKNQLDSILNTHKNRRIDLASDPLCTFKLIQCDNNEYYFSYCIHHIISDGWSSGVIVSEVLTAYDQIKKGEFKTDTLDIQYVDYSYWYNNRIKSLESSKEYWKENLKNYNSSLKWLNSNGLEEKSFYGNEITFEFEDKQVIALNNLAEGSQSTLFMVALSLVKIFLYKYSRLKDLVVGTDFSGRDNQQIESQVGYFLKLIPVRTYIDNQSSFYEYLKSVKQTILNAFEHQDYPIENVIKDLEKEESGKINLFNVLVLFQNFNNIPDFQNTIQDLQIKKLPNSNTNALLDLTFEFIQIKEKLRLKIRYKSDVFQLWQIEAFWNQFNILLDDVSSNDGKKKINELKLHKKEALDQIENAVNYPSVLHLIEHNATVFSEKTALYCNGRELSYYVLNESINRIGLHLKNSINIGERIGILMNKNENAIITVLSILRAGGVFVPIDINYPQVRIQHIINDSKIEKIICDNDTKYILKDNSIDVLCFNEINKEIIPKHLLGGEIEESQLAYILYTSGSTGEPKGVMIDKRSLNYYSNTVVNYFKLNSQDRVLQQASLSFDTSIEEIFPALSVGATLDIIEEGGKDIISMIKSIEYRGLTVLSLTPLVINELNSFSFNLNKLRLLISGGDVIKMNYLDNFIGKIDIYNTYGPTETTVCASYKKIVCEQDLLSMGESIKGKSIVIIGNDNEVLPIGVEGEICIGGEGVFKGYLNQKELADNAMISIGNSSTYYKSGDYGYMDQNGEIIFKGRLDNQIKIRGQRIDIQEIENAILKTLNIKNSLVTTLNRKDEELEIVAYIQVESNHNHQLFIDDLAKLIPQYMIPKFFYQVEEFPSNVNGKIDLKSLKLKDFAILRIEDTFVAPENDIQEKVLLIWEKALKQDNISITNNFFHIGGNSLLLGKVKLELESYFSIELSFRNLYEANTIKLSSELIADMILLKSSRREFII